MEKKYKLPEENSKKSCLGEPMAAYEVKKKKLPVITEDELAETISREELVEYIFEKIDQLPGQ